MILKKESHGFVEIDRMEGFTFTPKNEPRKSEKREHSRPIEGEHSASKIFQKVFETPKIISLTYDLIYCRIVGACEEEMNYRVRGKIQQKLMFQTHLLKIKYRQGVQNYSRIHLTTFLAIFFS